MNGSVRVIALIPARRGSKGVPRKNTRVIGGRPLVEWTIEAALHSHTVSAVVVTSDDPEILEIAQRMGVDLTIDRPVELASDDALMIDVIDHALSCVEPAVSEDDVVVLLQPTSPLRMSTHIDEAVRVMFSREADAVVGICEVEHSPLLMNELPEDLSMKGFLRPEVIRANRQALPVHYRVNGAVYVGGVAYVLENRGFIGDATMAYVMPQRSSVDIDSEYDMEIASCLLGVSGP